MVTYRHRQIGWPTIVAADLLIIGSVVLMWVGGAAVAAGLILLLVGFVLLAFSVLDVRVGPDAVHVAFFAPFPAYRIPLDTIEDAQPVRNKAWWGWGLRKIPGGWMYNVFGLDAVELTRRDAGTFRIGTDDPDALATAIAEARARVS